MTLIDLPAFAEPMARQLALFIHLIAFAFSFVLVVEADLAMLKSRYANGGRDLRADAHRVAMLLVVLWVTGVALIGMGPGFDLEAIVGNAKITAKLTVVSVLTLNGVLLHIYAFPVFAQDGASISPIKVTACSILGAVSSVSWFCASLFGVSRIIAPSLHYQAYIGFYLLALAIGIVMSLLVVRPRLQQFLNSPLHVTGSAVQAA